MARRFTGIDIGRTKVRAVQLVRTRGGLRVERAADRVIEGGNAAGALRLLMAEAGFRRDAVAAAAMPGGAVFFEELKVDLPSMAHVRRVLKFRLEDEFPAPMDDLVVDMGGGCDLADGAKSVFVAAVLRSSLHARAALLAEAGISPEIIEADACAVHAAVAKALPEQTNGARVIVYVTDSYTIMGIAEKGRLLAARNIAHVTAEGSLGDRGSACDELSRVGTRDGNTTLRSSASLRSTSSGPRPPGPDPAARRADAAGTACNLAREIELTWRDTFGCAIPQSTDLVLGGEADLSGELSAAFAEELPCRVTVLDPFAGVAEAAASTGEEESGPGFGLAVGLALSAASEEPGGMNFLAADVHEADRTAGIRRDLIVAAAIAAVVAGLWVANVFVRWHRLEEENRHLDHQMRDLYLDTFPDEEQVVDASAQVDEHLGALRKKYERFASVLGEGAGPLRLWRDLCRIIPEKLKVTITKMSISGRSVILEVTTDSYGTLEKLERALEEAPEFTDVRSRPRGSDLRFTITMTATGT